VNYLNLHKELKAMEENPGTVRHLDLRNYSKELDKALENKEITERQYKRLDKRFMKI
jgi:hypothetical protein